MDNKVRIKKKTTKPKKTSVKSKLGTRATKQHKKTDSPSVSKTQKQIKKPSARKRKPEDKGLLRLRRELVATREQLKSVIAEHDASNEELQALNEEMQSSNEELVTSQEELQSTNEELVTVNDELINRNVELTETSNDLINILSGVQIPVILLGNGLQIRRFNDTAAKLLNFIPTDIGRSFTDIRTNIDLHDLDNLILDVISTLNTKEMEIQDLKGRWYSMMIRPYKTLDNRIEGVLISIVDIHEIKINSLRLKEARNYAQAIVETVREPLIVLNSDLKVLSANKAFYHTFKTKQEETENSFIFDLTGGRWNIPALRKLLEAVLTDGKAFEGFQIEIELQDTDRRTVLFNARRIYREEANAPLILLAIEDITERVRALEALRASEERYRSFIEVTGELGWTTNADGEVTEDLPSWRKYTGQTYEEIKGRGWAKALHPDDLEHVLQAWEKAIAEKSTYEVEYRIRRHDGVYRYFMVRGIPVFKADGDIREWVGTCIDITERKMVEEQVQRSLKEKEVLLKEIHHRVKNNLQVVQSLLNLQANSTTDKAVRAIFEESRNRVTSMSLIHEKLYGSADLAHIDFKEYLQSLVAGIAETYKWPDIVISVEMESIALTVNVGIPCGLIVNELVSNSLKYAFPDGRAGTIKLGINKNSDGNYVLSVFDNGIGFPESLDFRNTESLGLQMVNVLAGQINGTIEFSNIEGTRFSITFPGQEKKESVTPELQPEQSVITENLDAQG